MPVHRKRCGVLFLASGLVLSGSIIHAQSKPASGPVARYDMRAGTVSGVGAMGGGLGSAMGMALGGGGNRIQHELYLRLGSSLAPVKGPPKADHFMPPSAKLGKSVPLLTPQAERDPVDRLPGQMMDKPKGRMLIFWGCGEHAPKGQPVIIDFAKLAAGQVPPGLWTSAIVRDWGPGLANSKTFGRWPNDDATGGNKAIKADASLIGPHRIAGNYSPEISFNLANDFMPALTTSTSSLPSGASLLRWNAMPMATGFYAMLFGGKPGPDGSMGDMVLWSSSASRQFGGGLDDWISPGQAAALVRDKVLLPPGTTTCTVPAEVRNATQFRFGTLHAYGPEENFSYPPRPADLRAAWSLDWTARIRHRSTTTWMDMPGMGAMQDMADEPQDATPAPSPRPVCKPKGFGGLLGGVLGAPSC